MLFYSCASFQMQHSLETQHGSFPIIAIVAIFIALHFSRVENFCLFLLLLSHTQLPCNLIHSAEPDRALCIIKLAHTLYIAHASCPRTHTHIPSPASYDNVYCHALITDSKHIYSQTCARANTHPIKEHTLLTVSR